MTTQRSQIFRACARGDSVARIAKSCGVSYARVWSHLRRAVAELDGKNPSALDAVRWQNYLMLMRIADQAFAAFERSAEEGVSDMTCQTIESADNCCKLRLTGKSVTRNVRDGAGDVRYLEVAMKALREIRDLFGIGAEAESRLRGAVPEDGFALRALMRTRAVRLATRWPYQSRAIQSLGGPWSRLLRICQEFLSRYHGNTLTDRDGLLRADHALREAILLRHFLGHFAAYIFSTPEALAA